MNLRSALMGVTVAAAVAAGAAVVCSPVPANADAPVADVGLLVSPVAPGVVDIDVSNAGPDVALDVRLNASGDFEISDGVTTCGPCVLGDLAPGSTVRLRGTGTAPMCTGDPGGSVDLTLTTASSDTALADNAGHYSFEPTCVEEPIEDDPCGPDGSVCVECVADDLSAGVDQDVLAGDPVVLSDHEFLDQCWREFAAWSQLSGPSVTLTADLAGGTGFIAPAVSSTSALVFRYATSADSDTVTITVHPRDLTPPTVTVLGVTATTYLAGATPTAGCSTTDDGSGVATPASLSTTNGTGGAVTATCSGAVDQAGNAASPVSVTYRVVDLVFAGFVAPATRRALPKPSAVLLVQFRLTNASGGRLGARELAALGVRGLRVTLSGPGLQAISAPCVPSFGDRVFTCVVSAPRKLLISGATYSLTVSVDVGSGFVAFPSRPGASNPVAIAFR